MAGARCGVVGPAERVKGPEEYRGGHRGSPSIGMQNQKVLSYKISYKKVKKLCLLCVLFARKPNVFIAPSRLVGLSGWMDPQARV